MSRRAAAAVLAPLALVGSWGLPAGADHDGVTAVAGSAYGVYANITLFGGQQPPNGPVPSVTLPPAGGSVAQSDTDGHGIVYGPATLFTAAALTVSSTGTVGPAGSVLSTANVVGDAEGVDPFRWSDLTASCGATAAGATGSTTVVGGTVTSTTGTTTVPTNPPPNHTVTGVVPNVNDDFRLVFNEQSTEAGVLTVTAAHLYLLGPTGRGDLVIGRVTCGVTATQLNHAPVAGDDGYSTPYQTALTVAAPGVLANDTDPDGDTLLAAAPSTPANGTVTVNADGSFTYTPNAGFSGTDTFTYTARDPDAAADTATVTVTVGAAPPPPPPGNEADLAVALTAAAGPPGPPHGIVTLDVRVDNAGPGDATGVLVFVDLPAGARFLDAAGADCVQLRGRLRGVACSIGTVESGGASTTSVVLDLPGRPGPATVSASVSSATPDPDATDDHTTVTATVVRRPGR